MNKQKDKYDYKQAPLGLIGKPVKVRRGPATVRGSCFPFLPLTYLLGRRKTAIEPEPGDLPVYVLLLPYG